MSFIEITSHSFWGEMLCKNCSSLPGQKCDYGYLSQKRKIRWKCAFCVYLSEKSSGNTFFKLNLLHCNVLSAILIVCQEMLNRYLVSCLKIVFWALSSRILATSMTVWQHQYISTIPLTKVWLVPIKPYCRLKQVNF